MDPPLPLEPPSEWVSTRNQSAAVNRRGGGVEGCEVVDAVDPPSEWVSTRNRPSPQAEAEANSAEAPPSPAAVVIEQCSSFKTRANQVKKALEKDVAGVKVVVNPEKPRRGCFEIREEGGEVFVSLLDMERPFPPLKALDMEKLIADIVEKIR